MSVFQRLWRCEQGSVGSAELVFLVTILAIGLVVAAKSLRDAAVTELADFAQSIANLDQSYNVPDLVLDDNGTPGIPRTTSFGSVVASWIVVTSAMSRPTTPRIRPMSLDLAGANSPPVRQWSFASFPTVVKPRATDD